MFDIKDIRLLITSGFHIVFRDEDPLAGDFDGPSSAPATGQCGHTACMRSGNVEVIMIWQRLYGANSPGAV